MLGPIKPEIRIVGWDDAPFTFRDRTTLAVGVVCRGGTRIDGVMSSEISVDGKDATDVIASAVNGSKHKQQLRVIMLNGVTFGGFNVVDIKRLNEATGLPVMAVIDRMPDLPSIKKSLSKFADADERWKLIECAGTINKTSIKNGVIRGKRTLYYQSAGMTKSECENVIKLTSVNSVIPEPVRLAHIICSGIKNTRRKDRLNA